MSDQPWLRLLDLVREQLDAKDARMEIGGDDPTDECLLWAPVGEHRRLVAVFDAPPAEDDRRALTSRLCVLAESFGDVGSSEEPDAPATPRDPESARRELDAALAGLAERSGAESVWVTDIKSPVLWGSSDVYDAQMHMDGLIRQNQAHAVVEGSPISWSELLAAPEDRALTALRAATDADGAALVRAELKLLRDLYEHHGVEAVQRRLRAGRALVRIRARAEEQADGHGVREVMRGPDIFCIARDFAVFYQVVAVFPSSFSPLHAQAAIQKALPTIERLTVALPPIDPGPKGAKVIRLRG